MIDGNVKESAIITDKKCALREFIELIQVATSVCPESSVFSTLISSRILMV